MTKAILLKPARVWTDGATRDGWSVLVRGILRHLDPDAVLRLPPAGIPWRRADPERWLVIESLEITGRRLQSASVEWAFHAEAYL